MDIKNIVTDEAQSFLNENTYKVYHGTNQKFSRFNPKLTAQGIIWFTDSIDSIKTGEHGGAGNQIIMTRYITINNPAGWDEYQKYGLGQLQGMGYDGVILPDGDVTNYFVFSNKSISAKQPQDEIVELYEFDAFDDTVNLDPSEPTPLPQFGDRLWSISEDTGDKIMMANVNLSDARKLIDWWNANTSYYHFKKEGYNGMFNVIRQLPDKQ